MKKFVDREVSLNPIYDYAYVDVENSSGGTSKALMCSSDPKNPLFLGRDGAPGGLTMEQKAAVIATSIGDQGPNGSPRSTGMAYWRDHIQCCKLGGFAVSKEVLELVALTEIYRAQLEFEDPELFKKLTDIEAKNGNPTLNDPSKTKPELFNEITAIERKHETFDPEKGVKYDAPVYDVTLVTAADIDANVESGKSWDVSELEERAIFDADLLSDPLLAKDRDEFLAVGKRLQKEFADGPPTPVFH